MKTLRDLAGGLARRLGLRTRAGQRRVFQALSVASILVFVPIIFVRAQGDPYVYPLERVPTEPVGIVFGAEVVGDQPGSYLQGRLNLALALWHAGKFKVFLVTGDDASAAYDEPQAMHDYLVAHGVPEQLIVRDDAGFDTWQSCARAKQVFGVSGAIAISQSFHVPRAVYLCRAAGITTYGVGDPGGLDEGNPAQWAWNNLREVGSAFHAVYQAAFRPAPSVPGPRNDAVADALAAAAALPGAVAAG